MNATRRRRKEARPQELTEAALELFVEKGFSATRLDDVAARAGVSKGTLYLYFDSKEALFKAVIEEGVIPIIEDAELMLQGRLDDDPRELLRTLLRGWWKLIGKTHLSGIPKLMLCEACNFPELTTYYHQHVIQRHNAIVKKILIAGIEKGIFRAVNTDVMPSVIISPLVLQSAWRHSFALFCQQLDGDAFIEAHLDMTLAGLVSVNPD